MPRHTSGGDWAWPMKRAASSSAMNADHASNSARPGTRKDSRGVSMTVSRRRVSGIPGRLKRPTLADEQDGDGDEEDSHADRPHVTPRQVDAGQDPDAARGEQDNAARTVANGPRRVRGHRLARPHPEHPV